MIDWFLTNWISLLAIVAATYLPIWQINRTVRNEKEAALAEQRYAIYTRLESLFRYYTWRAFAEANPGGAAPFANTVNPQEASEAISMLLARPTIMQHDEIYRIAYPVKMNLPLEERLHVLVQVQKELEAKLKPELIDVMDILIKQALSPNQKSSPNL